MRRVYRFYVELSLSNSGDFCAVMRVMGMCLYEYFSHRGCIEFNIFELRYIKGVCFVNVLCRAQSERSNLYRFPSISAEYTLFFETF